MALDLYSPCPCGSGKKFKWCCAPIHAQIDKAFRLNADGQHEAAFRVMDEVVAQNATNPETWGRKALLLYQNQKAEEAENALQKALEINPSYPFGYLLRGLFRQNEGEIAGALMLFRKAADLYDPEAKEILADVYYRIAESEMTLRRPVAARAALQISLHLHPIAELAQRTQEVFGDKSHLPAAARKVYTFASPPATTSPEHRAAWNRILSSETVWKLTDAARLFEQLTQENAEDTAAWYNLGLVRAWLGDNRGGLAALDRYVSLEPDETKAGDAWALGEVLRFGHGMEDQADYVEHSVLFQIRDPQRLMAFLQQWEQERRLFGVQVNEQEGMINGIVLERSGLLTAGNVPNQMAKLGSYFLVLGMQLLRVWSVNVEGVERVRQELQQRAGPYLSEARLQRSLANFADTYTEAVCFPLGATSQAEADKLVREHVQRYFEDTWTHRRLRSLNNLSPIDAANQPELRKKLIGVVQFLQECAPRQGEAYDFDRLRGKLGLVGGGTPTTSAGAQAEAPSVDISAMSAADLASLQPEALTDEQVDQAYRTAQQRDAQDLAVRFAKSLVSRAPRADRPDRFPWYTFLIQQALAGGNTDAALDYLNEGERADCEHNEGRRRNDYELRRGQVHAKRGEADTARDVFERLIERSPAEMRYRGTAAESMLAIQPATALRFAEQGLAKAREKNDRDSEQYFMELLAAARKQAG
jgi:tetratricopeptide (TPR) repeat protein